MVPEARDAVFISNGGYWLMTMESDLVAVSRLASCTLAVNVLVPIAVGVPEIVPEEALRTRPLGRVPVETDQIYGDCPPATVRV